MASEQGFDLRAIRLGLKAMLENISGISVSLPVGQRAVSDEEQSWIMADPETQAVLTFRLTVGAGLGCDECRYEFDDAITPPGATEPGGFTVNVCGNRILTFSIKCECYEAEYLAFEYIERIRSNFARPSIQEAVKAFGCSWNDMTPSRAMTLTTNGRTVSVAGFDLILNTVSNLADTPVTTIEETDVQHEVTT